MSDDPRGRALAEESAKSGGRQVVVELKLQGPNISIKHPEVTLAPDRFFDPLYRKLQSSLRLNPDLSFIDKLVDY